MEVGSKRKGKCMEKIGNRSRRDLQIWWTGGKSQGKFQVDSEAPDQGNWVEGSAGP